MARDAYQTLYPRSGRGILNLLHQRRVLQRCHVLRLEEKGQPPDAGRQRVKVRAKGAAAALGSLCHQLQGFRDRY